MIWQGRSAALLALVFLVGLLPGSAAGAEPGETDRELADAFKFSHGSLAIVDGATSGADADGMWRAYVVQELNAAKEELRQLEKAFSAAMMRYDGLGDECERQSLQRQFDEERERLRSNISALRSIRGDKRGFFTKAWHKIGPSGRRVLRAFGNESLEILKSGGSLHGGVARRILFRLGRKELKRVAIKAVARKIQGRAAVAVGATEEECEEEEPGLIEPTATGKLGEDLPPAIPAGTYTGEFDDAVIFEYAWSDAQTSIESNGIEIRVAEDGSVTGSFEYEERGLAVPPDDSGVKCPGGGSWLVVEIDPGQCIGPALPQALEASAEFAVYTAYLGNITPKTVEHFCVAPKADPYPEAFDVAVSGYADGKIIGSIAGSWPFEVRLAGEDE